MLNNIRGLLPLVLVLIMGWAEAHQFSYDIHHRFSDAVRSFLPFDDRLPEIGSFHYYAALVHRDRIQGRRLAGSSTDQTPVTFVNGNSTYQISSFGYLYYANVSVGTPELDFLVALDTGSDLFWLPCDCKSCVTGVQVSTPQGPEEIKFNMYSLNTSTTGTKVACDSDMCQLNGQCSSGSKECLYELQYLSSNTSSLGYLVEDELHLTTDVSPSKPVKAKITLGCGRIQTGSFLQGGAPNGLFGLGMDNVSVPSILASQNVAANSFSMCFGYDQTGRISFGDKGSSTQSETPFIPRHQHQTYNVSLRQIGVGQNVTDVDISAIFDSGTSFTYLNDPAYTIITQSFDYQVQEKRIAPESDFPFEFCYALSSCKEQFEPPVVNLTMKGGAQFSVNDPIVVVGSSSQDCAGYCLAVTRSSSINIIGENFMTGYRIVFDRERMILGWEASNCSYTYETTNTLPFSPRGPAMAPSSIGTEATSGPTKNAPHSPGAGSALRSNSFHLRLWTCTVLVAFLQLWIL